MGELSLKPFEDACRMKHGNDEPEIKTAMLLATWQYKVMDPSWRPFKTVEADGMTIKEVVDDDDAELKQLLTEYGDDVCDAVKAALSEMIQHNRSGGYAVPKLWNFSEGRKATMKEVVKYVTEQLWKEDPASGSWVILEDL
uniref:Factor of DNA methylation 1-5/IDN2 domain-containing protein n=1 Tax=Arundo donax TaxID=35708 RepID=A0A0A9D527_ARUDO